jgi:hypothetical protein
MSRWAQGDGVASWHVHDHMLVYLHTKNLRYPPDLPLALQDLVTKVRQQKQQT